MSRRLTAGITAETGLIALTTPPDRRQNHGRLVPKLHMSEQAAEPAFTACGMIPLDRVTDELPFEGPVESWHLCSRCFVYWRSRNPRLDRRKLLRQLNALLLEGVR